MTGHFEHERELQGRLEATISAAEPGVDVLDVELDQPSETVRVYIDRQGGVDHELCVRVTHALRDTCPEYALEVSSPGIERPLRRREHFERSVGERVRIRRRGAKRPFTARLEQVDEDGVLVRREDESSERVPFEEIVRSNLAPELAFGAQPRPGSTRHRKGKKA